VSKIPVTSDVSHQTYIRHPWDVWHQTSDIKHQTSETRHHIRDVINKLKLHIRHQTFDIWRLISEVKTSDVINVWFLMSHIRCQTSNDHTYHNIWHQTSDMKLPITEIRRLTWDIIRISDNGRLTYEIRRLISYIRRRIHFIRRLKSDIRRPMPVVKHLISDVLCLRSDV